MRKTESAQKKQKRMQELKDELEALDQNLPDLKQARVEAEREALEASKALATSKIQV